jgi:hypothetical protein
MIRSRPCTASNRLFSSSHAAISHNSSVSESQLLSQSQTLLSASPSLEASDDVKRMKQAKAPVPRHLLLECPVPPMIGHVPSVHSRSADMQCKCSGAQQGSMSLKKLQGPLPGVERVRKKKNGRGLGGGEFVRNTWVTYCQ